MNTTRTCPECGKPLAPNGLQGLCPECMMKVRLANPTGEAGLNDTQIVKAPRTPPPSLDEVAKLFPQLEIMECFGRGGMGAVYKARQPKLDRFVALPGARVKTIRLPDTVFTSETVDAGKSGTNPKPQRP